MQTNTPSFQKNDPARLKSFLISGRQTIRQALKQMNHFGHRTIFVVDAASRLQGSVTDGDIRRWIIKDGNLKKPVTLIMHRNPVSFPEGTPAGPIKQKMLEREIDSIPVLGKNSAVVEIYLWTDLFRREQAVCKRLGMPVVIMAGGEGRRLGAITRVLPKPLVPIGEIPLLEHIMSRFRKYGCNDFRISLNYRASLVKAYLKDNNRHDRISYIEEKKPLGTAGSMCYLRNKVRTPFFLINCDIIIDADYADIFKFHRESGNKITLVTSMKHHTIPYGICRIHKGGGLRSITEKPEYDLLVNTGMYVLEPSVLADIPRNTFFNMPDLIDRYLEKKRKVGVYPISDKSWLDTGQIDELHNTLDRFGASGLNDIHYAGDQRPD